MSKELSAVQVEKLTRLAKRLIDQEKARVIVPAMEESDGFWFGGGNIIEATDGGFWLCGRYRNYGDSRTGTGAGARGLEFAIFHLENFGAKPKKVKAFSKVDFGEPGNPVVSIEGGALHRTDEGIELFVSTEKAARYPEDLLAFQKPGTGVWAIDRLSGATVSDLCIESKELVLESAKPETLHVKDPVAFDINGKTALVFCSHPFSWSSSNTGLAVREPEAAANDFRLVSDSILARGNVWDVAATRMTECMPVPQVGAFKNLPDLSLYFYDGAECLRALDENPLAAKRPRGYSCEELGGLAWAFNDDFPSLQRISINEPLFLSPRGTGCSRYVSTCVTDSGIYACWQQSQEHRGQPLVGYSLSMDEVAEILS